MSDPTARTTATYDRIAPAYDQRWIAPSPDFAGFRDRFASALSPGDRVADLGCGPGKDSAWFQEHGLKPVGVDRSIEMARLAAARDVPVVVGDLRHPPLAPMDGLWSCASLLHVPADETAPTLRAWHAALRPGGVLGLTTSAGEGEGWEQVAYDAGVARWFVHRSPDALLAALAAAGFEVRHQETRATHRTWFSLIATRSDAPPA